MLLILGIALYRAIVPPDKSENGLPKCSPERMQQAFEVFEQHFRATNGSKFDMDMKSTIERPEESAIAACSFGQALIFDAESVPGQVRILRDRDYLFLGCPAQSLADLIAAESLRGRLWFGFFQGRTGSPDSPLHIWALRMTPAFAEIGREIAAAEARRAAPYEALAKTPGVGHA